jgi:hypothetical protein
MSEYMTYASDIDAMSPQIYRDLEFDKMPAFVSASNEQPVSLRVSA